MAHGQAGAEITDDHSPTLTCVHEAPILFMADIVGTLPSGGNQTGGDRPPGTGAETAAAGYLIAFDTTQVTSPDNRSNPRAGDPCHPLAATAHPPAVAFPSFSAATQHITVEELSPTLGATTPMAVAYSLMPQNSGKDFKARQVEVAQPLLAGGPTGGNQGGDLIQQGWKVRRLTPNECARLQGFPDDHARIAWNGRPAERCPDGPQYKAYGNAMAVNVMRWLAERLAHELNRKDGR